MKERLVIVLIAVILGLLITTAGYFIYQSTQGMPSNNNTPNISTTETEQNPPTPTPLPSGLQLTIETPVNESISNKRTIDVKGKTNPNNTVIVSSNQEDVYATPTKDGSFSTSVTIDAGTNKIITRAVAPNGEEVTDTRVVTYSSEDF